MPGAPNRPPETTAAAPPPAPVALSPRYRSLARLAPSRVALLLDLWKGSPSPELVTPFDRADAAFDAGDFDEATNSLEKLSVRFAEPRWPTLPEPFKLLRVPIPAPMPPAWNPDHALAPAEREAKRARREADDQVALAVASLAWATAHGIEVADLGPALEQAKAVLSTEGAVPGFYERMEAVWDGVRSRCPRPTSGKARPAPARVEPEPSEA
jgi:hypothetical protein